MLGFVHANTISLDLRERILASYDQKEGTRAEIAQRFRVSLGMVKKLLQQRRRTAISPRAIASRGAKPKLARQPSPPAARAARQTARPDLARNCGQALALDCSLQAIHYVLAAMGLTYKKRRSAPASKTGRTSRGRGARWRRRQRGFDPARLIFLDESGAKTNMTRLRGRAPRGQRLHASAPQGHWHTTTMISSMRLDGSTACMTIEGATDTEVFRDLRAARCSARRCAPATSSSWTTSPPTKATRPWP